MRPISSTLIVIALFFVLARAAGAQADPDRTISDSLLAWKSGADAVWSYDIYADVIVRTLNDSTYVTIAEHVVRQRFLHGKWRVDLLRTHRRFNDGTETLWDAPGEVKAYAYNHDGGGVRYFSSQDNFGEVKVPGADPETRIKQLAPHLFEAFKSHYYGESYFSLLNYRAPAGIATNEDSTITLHLPRSLAPQPHNFATDDFVVQLSPEGGFQPTIIRYAQDLNGAPEVIVEIRNDIAQVSNEVWVPVRSIKRLFARTIAGNVDMPVNEEELRLDVGRSRFNIDIRPEVFEMPFPPGTVVYDKSTAANYVVNDGGKANYNAYAGIVQQKAEELDAARLSTSETKGRFGGFPLIVVNLFGVGAVALLLFLLVRKRSRDLSK